MKAYTTTIGKVTMAVTTNGQVTYQIPAGMSRHGFASWKNRNAKAIADFKASVAAASDVPAKASAKPTTTTKLRRAIGAWVSRDYLYSIVPVALGTWAVSYMGQTIAYFNKLSDARTYITILPTIKF